MTVGGKRRTTEEPKTAGFAIVECSNYGLIAAYSGTAREIDRTRAHTFGRGPCSEDAHYLATVSRRKSEEIAAGASSIFRYILRQDCFCAYSLLSRKTEKQKHNIRESPSLSPENDWAKAYREDMIMVSALSLSFQAGIFSPYQYFLVLVAFVVFVRGPLSFLSCKMARQSTFLPGLYFLCIIESEIIFR